MWAMSPIEVAIFDLEGGVSVGAADIRLPRRTFMCDAARWTSASRDRWQSRCGSRS